MKLKSLSKKILISQSGITLILSYSFLIKVAAVPKRGKGGIYFEKINGGIAQLVEHLPCKQGVIGSNPITSTIKRAHSSAG